MGAPHGTEMFACPACGVLHDDRTFSHNTTYSCCNRRVFERPLRRISAAELRVAKVLECFGDVMATTPEALLSSYEFIVLALIAKANKDELRRLHHVYPLHCRMFLEWRHDRERFLRTYGFGSAYICEHEALAVVAAAAATPQCCSL